MLGQVDPPCDDGVGTQHTVLDPDGELAEVDGFQQEAEEHKAARVHHEGWDLSVIERGSHSMQPHGLLQGLHRRLHHVQRLQFLRAALSLRADQEHKGMQGSASTRCRTGQGRAGQRQCQLL